jgi:hypothetical protein
MEPLIIGVEAADERLPDFYDALAGRLEGRGWVYVPHVVIPPNARVPVLRPPRLVVGLAEPDDVAVVESWAAEYLTTPDTELAFERSGRRLVFRSADSEAGRVSLRSLVSA